MNGELIPIGKIVKYQGKKGQVRLLPFIADLALDEYTGDIYTVDSTGTKLKRKVVSIKPHKNFWTIHFEGVNSISEAETFVGLEVAVYKSFFHKLPQGEYYWFEIIGLDVYDEQNDFIGKIESFFPTGSNDVYVLKKEGKELLIPATKEVIKQVDLKNKKMTIRIIDGLLEDE